MGATRRTLVLWGVLCAATLFMVEGVLDAANGDIVTLTGLVEHISHGTRSSYVLHIDGQPQEVAYLERGQAGLDKLATGHFVTVTGVATADVKRTTATFSSEPDATASSTVTVSSVQLAVNEIGKPTVSARRIMREQLRSRGISREATRRLLYSSLSPGERVVASGKISAIAIRVSICKAPGSTVWYNFSGTVNNIKAAIFGDGEPYQAMTWGGSNLNSSAYYTLQDAYRTCSYGTASIVPSQVSILEDTIYICPSGGFTFSCDLDTVNTYASLVDTILSMNYNIDTSRFDHTILFLPQGVDNTGANCSEAGLGTQSCVKGLTPCRVWANTAEVQLLMHELGHNYGLNHAGNSGPNASEYGDQSCSMGHTFYTCYNAPNMWRVGWEGPLDIIGQKELIVSPSPRYDLPLQLLSRYSFVRVVLDWMPGQPAVFLSYRGPVNASGLSDQMVRSVYIQTCYCADYNSVYDDNVAGCKTTLIGMLPEGGSWWNASLQLRVAVVSLNNTFASIIVCKPNCTATTCSACSGEPASPLTLTSTWYGGRGYEFMPGPSSTDQAGFWDDSEYPRSGETLVRIDWASSNGSLTSLAATYATGNVNRTVMHCGMPTNHSVDIPAGGRITDVAVYSVAGFVGKLELTINGNSSTKVVVGDCSTCKSSPVDKPAYAPGASLAAFMGSCTRSAADQPSMLNALAFWWATSPASS